MLDKIKANFAYVVAAVVAVLYALFRFEKKRADDNAAKLNNAEVDKKDAVAVTKQEANNEKVAAAVKAAEEEKGRKLTQDEMTEFLKGL
jgi:uncharacterized membrane protein